MNENGNDYRSDRPAAGWKSVYTIVKRNEKSIWIRIGTAFTNRDGSLNVKLDATPTNGELQIREPSEMELERSAKYREQRAVLAGGAL
jgi:hypothetical protein